MDKMKQYLLLTVVGIVAVLAGGWFLLVSPQRAKVATLHDSADQAQSQTENLRLQLARLRAEAKTLPDDQKTLAAIAAQLPPNPALPDLVNDLTKAAAKTGVDLQVISPAQPQPFSSGPATAGTTSLPATGATGATGSPGTAATAGSASGGTLYQIGMNLTAVGTYFQIEQFENALEHLQRAFIPSVLDLAPGDPLGTASAASGSGGAAASPAGAYNGKLTAHITGTVFELQTTSAPAASTLPPGTGATAPASGTSASPAPTH